MLKPAFLAAACVLAAGSAVDALAGANGRPGEDAAATALARADADGDGFLSAWEAMAGHLVSADADGIRVFAWADGDGDGALTGTELRSHFDRLRRAAIARSRQPSAPEAGAAAPAGGTGRPSGSVPERAHVGLAPAEPLDETGFSLSPATDDDGEGFTLTPASEADEDEEPSGPGRTDGRAHPRKRHLSGPPPSP